MTSLETKEKSVEITRSQTVGTYPKSVNEVVASVKAPTSQKLSRGASNADMLKDDRRNEKVPDLKRSLSLDLRHEMENLSLNSTSSGVTDQNQQQTFVPTGAVYADQQQAPPPLVISPGSPWRSPVTPLYEGMVPPALQIPPQQQPQPQQVLMTPLQGPFIPTSPAHYPQIPPTPGTQAYAGLGIGSLPMNVNIPPSPNPMYGMGVGVQPLEQMQFFQGSPGMPYTLSPMMTGFSPLPSQFQRMGGGLNDLQLPSSTMGNARAGSTPKVLSKAPQAHNPVYSDFGFGASGMGGQSNVREMNVRSQQMDSFMNRASSMLESLRYRMRTATGGGMNKSTTPAVYQSVGIHWSLRDIKGFAFDFAKDQFGSRFIQHKLEDPNVNQQEKDDIFAELQPCIPVLCKDVFGNYVIQKLLEIGVGTKEQHNIIFRSAINRNMVDLSRHMYGCRVIQKLVEQTFRNGVNDQPGEEDDGVLDVYKLQTQNNLLSEIGNEAVSLVFDQNGNHVIQKCIQMVKPISRISFFFEAFRKQYITMSAHSYGCRVVQRVLETGSLAVILDVVSEIMTDLPNLVTDQYANYVIQHIVQHQREYESFSHVNSAIGSLAVAEEEILNKLKAYRRTLYNTIAVNIMRFSQDKCGSNVVEKCVNFGSKEEKKQLVSRVMEPDILFLMMQDPYANYVVQKVIEAASTSQLDHIVAIVRKHEDRLKGLSYGKHILNKLNMGGTQRIPSFPVYN